MQESAIFFFYFSTKTHAVGTKKNGLNKLVLLSTTIHNMIIQIVKKNNGNPSFFWFIG